MADFREALCKFYIKERGVYFERDSVFRVLGKRQTGTKKDKFKLYCRKTILDQYFFYTTTSNYEVTDPNLTVIVNTTDWEEVSSPRLQSEPTFICLLHFDVLTFQEIFNKYITSKFIQVATLSSDRWNDLKQKYEEHRETLRSQKLDAMNIADFAILGVDSQQELAGAVARLGLD